MVNPFVYGEVVPAAAFVDREVELDRLTRDLLSGQKVFLISPRRYGKSSLVRQALLALPGGPGRSPSRSPSAATAPTSPSSRATRAPCSRSTGGRRGPGAGWPRCSAACAPRSASSPAKAGAGSLRRSRSPPRGPDATSRSSRRRSSRCPAASPRPRRRRMAVALDEFQAIGSFGADGKRRGAAGRACAARGRAAPAAGRLRLLRLRADADGADARQEPALLQGRPGHAAARRSTPPSSPASSRRGSAPRGCGRSPASAPPSSNLAGNLPYDVQRLAHEVWDDARAGGEEDGRRSTTCTGR